MKTAFAIAALSMLTALSAAAETSSPLIAHDPLMNQIMSKQLTQPLGGVTGAVRIGSGQAITLTIVDPLAPLKPVEGLAPAPAAGKAAAKTRRKTRRADAQLKKMSEEQRRADWAGRK